VIIVQSFNSIKTVTGVGVNYERADRAPGDRARLAGHSRHAVTDLA